jgi:DNA-directed RNA polymerase specialized sigma24 family protein
VWIWLRSERLPRTPQLDTEGVVHEAFALMLRYQGTVANPPGWLCTVARRLVGRANARQQRILGGDPCHDNAP